MNAALVSSCLRRGGAALAHRAPAAQNLLRLNFSSEASVGDGVNRHPAGPLRGVRVLDMTRCGAVVFHAFI